MYIPLEGCYSGRGRKIAPGRKPHPKIAVYRNLRSRMRIKAALEIRAAWAKERDELEANESKATPSGGKTAFSIERRAVTVVFD